MSYAYDRNVSVMHASASMEAIRTRSNDERGADWYSKYRLRGLHRSNGKPRIRVTVPSPSPVGTQYAPPHPQAAPAERASRRSLDENPFLGDVAPEVIARYADIRGV